jgi:hypothetical protein
MALGMECPKEKCHHQMAHHDAVMTGDGNHFALVCKVCLANGVRDPVCGTASH